jgi:hypothetical protein
MGWPAWVEEIARRYLADEASVFVVHGDVEAKVWTAEDGTAGLDAAQLLVHFLRRSREIVAVLRPGPPPARLEFAEYSDRGRFETLVRAADVLAGKALPLVETDPMQALGRVWRALSTVGTAQAYVVSDTERLLPAAKKWIDPVPGAPDLMTWSSQPTLRTSNNLVVFLCRSLDGVRPELLAPAAARVALRDERRSAEAEVEAEVEAELGATVDAPPRPPEPEPPAPPPAAEAEGPSLHDELARHLIECLGVHSEDSRPARVPVMDAVARAIAGRDPDRFGPLTFGFDPESGVRIEGDGAERFRATWQGDIALDASAGMILGKLPTGFTPAGPTTFDATGMKALVRRVERLLSR